jgi:hypothetical protein
MKRIFAVALLLLSFASVALADEPGMMPPPQSGVVQLADGPGQIPPQAATQPPLVSVAA